MTILDMRPLLSGEKDEISFDVGYTPIREEHPDIDFYRPAKLVGRIRNMSGYMCLELEAEFYYKTFCARCLKELTRSIRCKAEKGVAEEGTLQDEEALDYAIIRDGSLDLGEEAEEMLFLELPSRHLCKDDCKGLCPKCGCDLNEESCSCVLKEPDARLLPLLELLKTGEESEDGVSTDNESGNAGGADSPETDGKNTD